jgi:hypothetical protein
MGEFFPRRTATLDTKPPVAVVITTARSILGNLAKPLRVANEGRLAIVIGTTSTV